MIEGTILTYKDNSGQIKGDDGKTYVFNRRALGGGDVTQATPGRRVRFQSEGERAREVMLLAQTVPVEVQKPKPVAPQQAPPQISQERVTATATGSSSRPGSSPGSSTSGSYRFLNPYNFVRYLDRPRPKGDVLGDCAPPPHDRYTGLTGMITCHVTTTTPLFVSDAHEVEPDKDHSGHRIYRFFRLLNEQNVLEPALPASSLRGMLRSVFEAVTNSCFSVFEKDEEREKKDRLEHRVNRDPGLTPARVLDIDQHGATLELFDCTTMSPPVRCTDQPTTVKSGMVSAYTPVVLKRQRGGNDIPFSRYGIVTPSFHDGERVAALVTTTRVIHRSRRFQWFPVVQMVPVARHATLVVGAGQQKVFGFVHRTGPNIENKHDERLFFRWDDQDPAPRTTYTPKKLHINNETVEEFNRILKKYWERHEEKVEELQVSGWPTTATTLPHPSVFVREDRKLRQGDLVYYFKDNWGIEHIAPVSMPRVPYHHPREKLLPKHLDHCTSIDALCPACRTFGWVHEDATKMPAEAKVASAGRIRITHGVLKKSAGTLDEPNGSGIPLAILSSPKPTATAFYLLTPNGRPGETDYDQEKAKLRGRKFYRHHGQWENLSGEQQSEHRRAGDRLDKQNRTVKGVLNPGAEFEFDVHFENLQPVELGALLWTIQLEPGMHHRLGFGKPLGFGSLQIKITLQITSTNTRYLALTPLDSSPIDSKRVTDDYISQFEKAMERAYAEKNERFDVFPNVMDLKTLLSNPKMAGPIRVHYPRHERTASAEGENFKWFVGNRRRLDDSRRPVQSRKLPPGSDPQWLALPSEDHIGLELLDENGNRV